MQSELRLHRLVIGILALLLGVFITAMLSVYPSPPHQHFEVVASLVVVIVAASAFVMIGMVEGVVAIQFGMGHKRELLGYLLLGLISLVTGLYLAISNSTSLQTIAVVVSPHAVLFGVGEIRLAAHMRRHPVMRKGLFISGLCETALGVALLSALHMSNQHAAMLLGYTAILSALQLVPFLFYKRLSPSPSPMDNKLLRKRRGKEGVR